MEPFRQLADYTSEAILQDPVEDAVQGVEAYR